MRFVLVRHAESGNNRLWADSGSEVGRVPDPALTELGRQQASLLAEYLAAGRLPWRVTHLYTSLMSRAIQTAAPLAEALDLPLRSHGELHEVGGPYELVGEDRRRVPHPGSARAALAALSPRLELPEHALDEGWWTGEYEDDEAEMQARATRVVDSVRDRHADEDTVLLVTHGWFSQYLLRELLGAHGMGGWFAVPNTGVSLLAETTGPRGRVVVAEWVGWLPHLAGAEGTT